MKKKKRNKTIDVIVITLLALIIGCINVYSLLEKDQQKHDVETSKYIISNEESTSVLEPTTSETTTSETTTKKKTTKKANTSKTYKLTHYGPDCKGCSGKTASGYNVKSTIWYSDKEYGKVRVCATSSQFKLYSIIKIKDYKLGEINCIVLDRGVGSGVIDLLVSSEKVASKLGIQRVNIELLRSGK